MAVLLMIFPALAAAQTYDVVLARPTKAGATHRIVASGYESEKTIVTAGDQVVQQKEDEVSVELTASVTVLEVNERARPTKASLTIETSTATRGTTSGTLLPRGTVVVVSVKDNKDVYMVGDSPAADDVAKALSAVFTLPKSKESDDDIFGTREKKRVGDTWPINAELAATSLKDVGLRVNKDDVEGSVALKGVVKVGQEECLDIQAWLDIKAFDLQLPDGFNVVEGRLQAKFAGKLPTNKTLGRVEDNEQMTMTLKATGKPDANGPEVTINVSNVKRTSTRLTYPTTAKRPDGN
jgi:hypothetical protein